ncbi:MAG: hypothetical protein AB8F95_20040 [Bacteroidia bacterium]
MSNSTTYSKQSPWLYHAPFESAFILAPAFLVTALVMAFPHVFGADSPVPPYAWLLLVVFIDVAHVYSTLYRTYFDKEEFQKFRKPLTWVPILSLLGMILLYLGAGSQWFWTVLAYLAVFHFVRQQYGFFRLYSRKEQSLFDWERKLDATVIYGATLYPIIYWHCNLPRKFSWFMPGDFLAIPWTGLADVAGYIYAVIVVAYVLKEIKAYSDGRTFNLPKQGILIGTIIVWYVGIVLYNGDIAFTATNVAAHGIPYMALIWLYGRKKLDKNGPKKARWFRIHMLPAFIGIIIVLAYLEEGLWDGLVWRDHSELFPWAEALPFLESPLLLGIAIPLLALPQVTHYVIDGFIWKQPK